MNSTFESCSSLLSLNLSNFNTVSVKYINSMFAYCSSLTSLNLSNFITQSVINMNLMFYGCNRLEYINLQLYNEFVNELSIDKILFSIPENIVLCMKFFNYIFKYKNKKQVNENNAIDKLRKAINGKLCPTIFCGYDWKAHQKRIINNACFENDLESIKTSSVLNIESTNNINILSTYIPEREITTEFFDLYTSEINNIAMSREFYGKFNDVSSTNLQNEKTISTNNNESTEKLNQKVSEETTNEITNKFTNKEKNNNNIEIHSNYISEEERFYSTLLNTTFNESEVINIIIEDPFIKIRLDYFNNSNYTSEELNYLIYVEIINSII